MDSLCVRLGIQPKGCSLDWARRSRASDLGAPRVDCGAAEAATDFEEEDRNYIEEIV